MIGFSGIHVSFQFATNIGFNNSLHDGYQIYNCSTVDASLVFTLVTSILYMWWPQTDKQSIPCGNYSSTAWRMSCMSASTVWICRKSLWKQVTACFTVFVDLSTTEIVYYAVLMNMFGAWLLQWSIFGLIDTFRAYALIKSIRLMKSGTVERSQTNLFVKIDSWNHQSIIDKVEQLLLIQLKTTLSKNHDDFNGENWQIDRKKASAFSNVLCQFQLWFSTKSNRALIFIFAWWSVVVLISGKLHNF